MSWTDEDDHETTPEAASALVDLPKLASAAKAPPPREALPRSIWALGSHLGRHQRDGRGRPAMDPLRQTDSRFRPLARRRARTARPLFVLIRTRNPCVLFRWRLFG